MTTDWILMRRAAAELDRALTGGRVTDVGLLEDGRFALRLGALRKRGGATLAADPFGSPPLVTLSDDRVALAGDPGWTRAMSAALRGMRVTGVRARIGDRVVVVSFATQSRFGVESEARLVLELIPRYGNVLLLRDRTIVSAAKHFSPAENEARSIQVGTPYQPPPVQTPALDLAGFTAALARTGDRRARSRALGGFRPDLPRLLAESLVAEAETAGPAAGAELAAWLAQRADALLSAAGADADGRGDLYIYRDGGRIVQAHVVALAQYAGLAHERAPSLLEIFAAARSADDDARASSAIERRRHALAARIAKRREAIARELASVEARRADAAGRDALRAAGDALYTHATDVPERASSFVPPTQPDVVVTLDPELDAKANAAAYFARYRKAADALPHLELRVAALRSRAQSFEELAFEAERADGNALEEIALALDELDGRTTERRKTAGKPRTILRIERPSGARIFVGRSPRENVEVTFKIARAGDLWFHARNVPGSHVVLQMPSGGEPEESDLDAAADLAATHSKARAAPRVDVDYTERKYVRKRRDGAPGLVWYTNARTRIGRPTGS